MDPAKHTTLIAQLQKEYIAGFDEKFRRILGFHKKRDWQALKLEYHNLKGTGTTYGMSEVTELCQQMEKLCQKNTEMEKETLEISIELLKKIADKYRDQKPFVLSENRDFIKLKSS